MKILLLSAYDTPSHKYWREGLVAAFSEYTFTQLTLPARFFAWRIRGSALSFSLTYSNELKQHYDLIIATSMLDITAFKGLNTPLASTPCILYFHENQFAYPLSENQTPSVEAQMVNIYSALGADQLLFNSQYNLDTFMRGAKALIKKLPDYAPKHILKIILDKSTVVPVPLNNANTPQNTEVKPLQRERENRQEPLTVVWNHRWEYDKGPDRLLHTIKALPQSLNITFVIMGMQFRNQPKEMDELKRILTERGWLKQFGYVASKKEYAAWLAQSDVVLSTALHDFQGLSIIEAVVKGCIPLLPNRVAYPELFKAAYLYEVSDAKQTEAHNAASQLEKLAKLKQSRALPQAPNLNHINWRHLKPQYQAIINTFKSI